MRNSDGIELVPGTPTQPARIADLVWSTGATLEPCRKHGVPMEMRMVLPLQGGNA